MPAQRIIFWENACKIACIKYEFLSLGFSLEVSENTKNKKDKIKKTIPVSIYLPRKHFPTKGKI